MSFAVLSCLACVALCLQGCGATASTPAPTPVLGDQSELIRATLKSFKEFFRDPYLTLAGKYGAEITMSNGTTFDFNQFLAVAMYHPELYPINLTVQVPYVQVKNSLQDAIMVQQAAGTTCQRLAPGATRRFPLVAVGVTLGDAMISLGGAFWIREADADCSTACRDCFWWWTDSDRPQDAFLAQVGFGPAIPMSFFGSFNETEMQPKSYAGISELELKAHKWTLGGIDDGIEYGLDWTGSIYGAVALDEVVTVNCSVGADGCRKMIKPFRSAEIDILGTSAEQPLQQSFGQKFEQPSPAASSSSWPQKAMPIVPMVGLVFATLAFVAVCAGARRRRTWSRVSDGTDFWLGSAQQTMDLI